jgi:hypothetical protein
MAEAAAVSEVLYGGFAATRPLECHPCVGSRGACRKHVIVTALVLLVEALAGTAGVALTNPYVCIRAVHRWRCYVRIFGTRTEAARLVRLMAAIRHGVGVAILTQTVGTGGARAVHVRQIMLLVAIQQLSLLRVYA